MILKNHLLVVQIYLQLSQIYFSSLGVDVRRPIAHIKPNKSSQIPAVRKKALQCFVLCISVSNV
jgi:hypothetical protein